MIDTRLAAFHVDEKDRIVFYVEGCYPEDVGGYEKIMELTTNDVVQLIGAGITENSQDWISTYHNLVKLFPNKGYTAINVHLGEVIAIYKRDFDWFLIKMKSKIEIKDLEKRVRKIDSKDHLIK
ncbi:MAG: hypothetical protein WC444_04490 [Candidatus Paceibacterota bacterium]